jgi:hypothetical protein
LIGKTISPYRISEMQGGGMGVVYKAGFPRLDRFLAREAGNKDKFGTTEKRR